MFNKVFNWCYLLVLLIILECVSVAYYLRTVNKLMLKAEMGVPLHEHTYKPSIWRRSKLLPSPLART